jgi:hypothetical protein
MSKKRYRVSATYSGRAVMHVSAESAEEAIRTATHYIGDPRCQVDEFDRSGEEDATEWWEVSDERVVGLSDFEVSELEEGQ